MYMLPSTSKAAESVYLCITSKLKPVRGQEMSSLLAVSCHYALFLLLYSLLRSE